MSARADHETPSTSASNRRVLVAGVGNIFLGDDGFGVEVVRRLATRALPERVKVADFGIRGVHLAYELLDGAYDTTILVDATARGGRPGTVYLIEPEPGTGGGAATPGASSASSGPGDAHGMTPDAVFALLAALGGVPGRVLVVGCEPASTEEGIGLSDVVACAVDEAVALVAEQAARACGALEPPDDDVDAGDRAATPRAGGSSVSGHSR